jgi:hypothetical protein
LTISNIALTNSYVNVWGQSIGGSYPGGDYTGYFDYPYTSSTMEWNIANDAAGLAWDALRVYTPVAVTKFGASRSLVQVKVCPGTSCESRYDPAWDDIELKGDRLITYGREEGVTVAVHEYGHAFQFGAIESPRGGNSGCVIHNLATASSYECAFVEGFAEFFAAWVAGPSQLSGPYADYNIELNGSRSFGDGSKIEGAVAGFLYDLVDNGSETDGPGGVVNGDDDSVSLAGSTLVSLLRTCAPGANSQINGIDEFIYCAENDVTAYLGNPFTGWRSYSTVTPGTSVAVSASTLRQLWRYDLFAIGSLP